MQRGDSRAFARFVDLYGDALHRLARRYAASEADAEDLTQEIFVALSRSIGGFRGDSRLSTWVYRIALNHCLKHVERRRPDCLPLEDGLLTTPGGVREGPEAAAERGELAREVHAALETLSDGHRDVVILHEMHGLTYAECAEALGIPVGTVKSRLSNAFVRLRERLGGYVSGDEKENTGPRPESRARLVGAGTCGETRR